MGFRFRQSAAFGPLRFHFSKGGLSSISIGGRGASLNIPVARSGGVRTTVGLPGTGLSWSVEQHAERPSLPPPSLSPPPPPPSAALPNSRRLRPGQLEALRQSLLALLQRELATPEGPAARLWERGAVSRLLADGALGGRSAGLLALIETPEAMEAYVLRARSQDDAKRRARRCLEAVQLASRLAASRGWLA